MDYEKKIIQKYVDDEIKNLDNDMSILLRKIRLKKRCKDAWRLSLLSIEERTEILNKKIGLI